MRVRRRLPKRLLRPGCLRDAARTLWQPLPRSAANFERDARCQAQHVWRLHLRGRKVPLMHVRGPMSARVRRAALPCKRRASRAAVRCALTVCCRNAVGADPQEHRPHARLSETVDDRFAAPQGRTAFGRSATIESERERLDRRRSQFDPLPTFSSARSRRPKPQKRTFSAQAFLHI